ncbi:uncharacterized mitochondrial protein-like protein [Tanacetum coccineum]
MAATTAACQAIWLRELLAEVTGLERQKVIIRVDNKSTIALSKNSVFHGRSKHIHTRYHFIRECVENEQGVIVGELSEFGYGYNACSRHEMISNVNSNIPVLCFLCVVFIFAPAVRIHLINHNWYQELRLNRVEDCSCENRATISVQPFVLLVGVCCCDLGLQTQPTTTCDSVVEGEEASRPGNLCTRVNRAVTCTID